MWESVGILFFLFMPFVYLFVLVYLLFSSYVYSKFEIEIIPDLIEYPRQLSVVIPFRNEENSIKSCIEAIRAQRNLDIEFILVNDHSDDLSAEIAEVALVGTDGKVVLSVGNGKKAALLTGIKAASYPVIWTTDADCIVSKNTLSNMLGHFHFKRLNMLCGLVQLNSGSNLFGVFQQAESAALVGISSVFLNVGRPATCNGANLMFRKDVFDKLGGYGNDFNISSGDDDLLMQRFAEYDIQRVRYHNVPEFKVNTVAELKLNDFIRQRARWASKRRQYKFPYNAILLVLMVSRIFFYFFLLLLSLVSGSAWFIIPLFILILSDLLIAVKIRKLLDFKLWVVPLMPVYQLYIPFVLFYGFLKKPKWKGREIISSNEKI